VAVRSGKGKSRERRADRGRDLGGGVTHTRWVRERHPRWKRQGLGDSRVEKRESVRLLGEKN
jgi:hypothetical protein